MNRTICILGLAFLLTACGEEETPAPEESPQTAQEESSTNEREVRRSDEQSREEPQPLPRRDQEDPSEEIPRLEGEAEEGGYGLTMVVDGSTPEAFQESLELMAMDTSKEQYRQLDSALRYLGTYDTAAWTGLPDLYENLDGMTGEEIIERAREMRRKRTER